MHKTDHVNRTKYPGNPARSVELHGNWQTQVTVRPQGWTNHWGSVIFPPHSQSDDGRALRRTCNQSGPRLDWPMDANDIAICRPLQKCTIRRKSNNAIATSIDAFDFVGSEPHPSSSTIAFTVVICYAQEVTPTPASGRKIRA